jgi:hypothetical protein
VDGGEDGRPRGRVRLVDDGKPHDVEVDLV